jgi:hypothetical protein
MSKTSAKLALALLVVPGAPSASYARMAGVAGSGNVPISGIPPGPANAVGMNNVTVDPSGIANASKIPPLHLPRSRSFRGSSEKDRRREVFQIPVGVRSSARVSVGSAR